MYVTFWWADCDTLTPPLLPASCPCQRDGQEGPTVEQDGAHHQIQAELLGLTSSIMTHWCEEGSATEIARAWITSRVGCRNTNGSQNLKF